MLSKFLQHTTGAADRNLNTARNKYFSCLPSGNLACDKNYKNAVNLLRQAVKLQPAKSNAFTRLLIFTAFVR